MSKAITPIKGMPDIVPEQMPYWHHAEAIVRQVLEEYGYDELRTPMLEKTALFKRSIGDETDIVAKEMFTFESRSGISLSLRPEATASCVRAGISRGLLHNQRRRLYYYGPMFRYEQPQEGRYRQFYQFGAEAYGLAGPDVDAEMILMLARIWSRLQLSGLRLKINCLGSDATRERFTAALQEHFRQHEQQLDPDSQRRLDTNPLRILDSKASQMQALIDAAPQIQNYLGSGERAHFDGILQRLETAGIAYDVEPRLVRGLDYYTGMVFEWQTDQLGAQNAVCGGGRYDHLVRQLGGRDTPAVGWAMGMERLIALLALGNDTIATAVPGVYLVSVGDRAARAGLGLLEKVRDALPGVRMIAHGGAGSFKSQLRAADRSGARFAVIIGDDEVDAKTAGIKSLRGGTQTSVAWDDLVPALQKHIAAET
ncbi:MAG: histidine--tRNA ligase [Gammaproteobacteria bacterium]|nr:histidine--tRNA ligase [Gammaproteobacteria bacterium]